MVRSKAQIESVYYWLGIFLRFGSFLSYRLKVVLMIVVVFVGNLAVADSTIFPKDFKWCVASAAYQIEGGNLTSDWSKWELEPNRIKNSENALIAVDHWNRVDEDIELMRFLHVTDYRMSVEWAKIEPKEGQLDQVAIAHYREEIQKLENAHIRPMITLQHFTLPEWVRLKGGFEWHGIADAFANYSELVFNQIAPNVEVWITLNEPMISIANGYVTGNHPPGEKRELKNVLPVVRGMVLAHARAYHRMHAIAKTKHKHVEIGVAHHLRAEEPKNPTNPLDRVAASLADQIWNWVFPTAIESGRLQAKALWVLNYYEDIRDAANTQDFIGVNYYSGDAVSFSLTKGLLQEPRSDLPKSDLGWAIYAEGFLKILEATARHFPGKKIIITENGIADANDSLRPKFMIDHLKVISKAIEMGIPVKGYCHWSLMDNFEWQEGYTPRFGLFEMDYKTLQRKPRASAYLFRSVVDKNGF